MASPTMRVPEKTMGRVRELVKQIGIDQQSVVELAVDRLWRAEMLAAANEDFARLQGDPRFEARNQVMRDIRARLRHERRARAARAQQAAARVESV